ncbi:MAG: tol-pal system protein YbgF [Thermodesulfobacteriota bacterium]
MRTFLFISFFLMFIASCASQKDMVHLNKQVNALYRQVKEDVERDEDLNEAVDQLQLKESKLEEEIARQASKQNELERQFKSTRESPRLEALTAELDSVRSNVAQLQADLLGVREQVQDVTGQVEESNHLIRGALEKDTTKTDAITSQVNELSLAIEDLGSRVGTLENYVSTEMETRKQQASAHKNFPLEQREEAEMPAPKKKALTQTELYDRALGYHRDGRHQEAIADFRAFLKLYPNSNLADNACFWIGESQGAQGRYEEAILAYQKVITDYPDGNKVPAAMLSQGIAFENIDDKTTAELVYRKLVKNFPKSREAEIAQKKLQGNQ